jgi:hypothetical protein
LVEWLKPADWEREVVEPGGNERVKESGSVLGARAVDCEPRLPLKGRVLVIVIVVALSLVSYADCLTLNFELAEWLQAAGRAREIDAARENGEC